jgi:hypothetical protein
MVTKKIIDYKVVSLGLGCGNTKCNACFSNGSKSYNFYYNGKNGCNNCESETEVNCKVCNS